MHRCGYGCTFQSHVLGQDVQCHIAMATFAAGSEETTFPMYGKLGKGFGGFYLSRLKYPYMNGKCYNKRLHAWRIVAKWLKLYIRTNTGWCGCAQNLCGWGITCVIVNLVPLDHSFGWDWDQSLLGWLVHCTKPTQYEASCVHFGEIGQNGLGFRV